MQRILKTALFLHTRAVILPAVVLLLFSGPLFAQRGYKPKPPGVPQEIQITPYKTTMIADGKDKVLITLKIIDSKGDTLPNAQAPVTLYLKGDAKIVNIGGAGDFNAITHTDTSWQLNGHGSCRIILQAGRTLGHIKLQAKSDSLWTGGTEIHTVQPGKAHLVTTEKYTPRKVTDKILGADISFLPQMEARGTKFYDNGQQGDPLEIMKAHGFNYI